MAEEQAFPTLTDAQIARIAAKGRRRAVARGEVLIAEGQAQFPLIVAGGAELEAVRSSCDGEEAVATLRAGQFSGELNLLTARPGLVTVRATSAGEVIELDRDALLALVQTDAELSEILMRAFILRRLELIAHHFGDVVVLGSGHCAGTLRVKDFLIRNNHPFQYIDLDRDEEAQQLLDRFH